MTFTNRELLAICFHIAPRQVQSLEAARARREMLKEMGISDLYADVCDIARSPQVAIGTDWLDRKASRDIELSPASAFYLREATAPPYNGIDADVLLGVYERLG